MVGVVPIKYPGQPVKQVLRPSASPIPSNTPSQAPSGAQPTQTPAMVQKPGSGPPSGGYLVPMASRPFKRQTRISVLLKGGPPADLEESEPEATGGSAQKCQVTGGLP